MFWSGAQGDIPAGWQVADGTNGTPDLRNVFPRCSGPGSMPGSVGGAASHTHPITGELFDSALDEGNDIDDGTDFDVGISEDEITPSIDTASNFPPYRALFPIIFLGN